MSCWITGLFWLVLCYAASMSLAQNTDTTSDSKSADAKHARYPPINDLPPRPYPLPPLRPPHLGHQQPHPAGIPPPAHAIPPNAAGHPSGGHFRPVPSPPLPLSQRPPASAAGGLNPASSFSPHHQQHQQRPTMTVTHTQVSCHGMTMQVELHLSMPFWGIIYPYGHYSRCVLYEGNGERHITLTLARGVCGDQTPSIAASSSSVPLSPLIEHRLMVQWSSELVEEWDSSIIVRCDRPQDYNKTIDFDLTALPLPSHLTAAAHARPQMWMQLQKGEGPYAPQLQGAVRLGQLLTLVFTLSHEYFHFDANVLACWAFDGGDDDGHDINNGGPGQGGNRPAVDWARPQHQLYGRPRSSGPPPPPYAQQQQPQQSVRRRSIGELQTVQEGCSLRTKIFGNFHKKDDYEGTGGGGGGGSGANAVTLFAFFKAFRFPTSDRVTLQCSVQVCFRRCGRQPPCQVPFHPRQTTKSNSAAPAASDSSDPADHASSRHRRSTGDGHRGQGDAEDDVEGSGQRPDGDDAEGPEERVHLMRTVKVLLLEEPDDEELPSDGEDAVLAKRQGPRSYRGHDNDGSIDTNDADYYSMWTLFLALVLLSLLLALLVALMLWLGMRRHRGVQPMTTPTK